MGGDEVISIIIVIIAVIITIPKMLEANRLPSTAQIVTIMQVMTFSIGVIESDTVSSHTSKITNKNIVIIFFKID